MISLLPSDYLKIFAALHALDTREAASRSIISGVMGMRRVADFANKVTAGIATSGFERRQVARRSAGVTCLVLVKHGQTDKALLVSDCGIHSKAVWVPKAMITIEQPSDRGILVATMPQAFADQKRLSPRWIDPTLFNDATRDVLAEANARAARKRNFYRKHRQGHARFDTQYQFC